MTFVLQGKQKGQELPAEMSPSVYLLVSKAQPQPSLCRRIIKGFLIAILVWFLLSMICSVLLAIIVPINRFKFDLGREVTNGWKSQSNYGGRISDSIAYSPEQLHLSLGEDPTELYVTWSTMKYVDESRLVYREAKPTGFFGASQSVGSNVTHWKTAITNPEWIKSIGGHKHRVLHTYRAKMTNLKPGKLYIYMAVSMVDSFHYSSKVYNYYARDFIDTHSQMSLALYGDLGLFNGQSTARLIRDVDDQKYDVIVHNGDFAYDLDTKGGKYGDEFMRMIEPIAARVPYQTSVGNHESAENFTHYDNRFTMVNSGSRLPGEQNNFFYSFNVGPIHFVAFSTEHYYFVEQFGIEAVANQYKWLKEDLAHANSPAERAKRPWIVVFGHRPMYCSGRDGDDCTKDTNLIRKGLPTFHSFALEKLFYDNGVDVELYSHEHKYERFLPLYDGKVMSGTTDPKDPYRNPLGPVHLISGSAGCEERLDPNGGVTAPGSVKQISDYGFTRLHASRCQLKFEQVSDDRSGTITDQFVITKDRQNFPVQTQELISCKTKPRHQYECLEELGSWFCNSR